MELNLHTEAKKKDYLKFCSSAGGSECANGLIQSPHSDVVVLSSVRPSCMCPVNDDALCSVHATLPALTAAGPCMHRRKSRGDGERVTPRIWSQSE